MENPETWGSAEKIVQGCVDSFFENMSKPPEEKKYGFSLAAQVTSALRSAGLLREEG